MDEASFLSKVCENIYMKGIDDVRLRQALHGLMPSKLRCRAKSRPRASCTCQPASLLLSYACDMTKKLHSYRSMTDKGDSLFLQLQHAAAPAYTAVAICWDKVVGQQEPNKLAVATAVTKSGLLETLTSVCGDVTKELTAILEPAPCATMHTMMYNPEVRLAISIINLWWKFISHWPSSGRVLVGKHMGMLTQPVARLMSLLLQCVNKHRESDAPPTTGKPASGAITAAINGSLTLAECLGREITAASALQQGEAATHQNLLASLEVQMLFSLGVAVYITKPQQLYGISQQQGVSFPNDPHTYTDPPLALFQLLDVLQLNALSRGLVVPTESAGLDLQALQDWHKQSCSMFTSITQVFEFFSQQQQPQQYSVLLKSAGPLLGMLQELVLASVEANKHLTGAAADVAQDAILLSVEAMLAIWKAQLSAADNKAAASTGAPSVSSSCQQSTTSIAIIEQCIRSAGTVNIRQGRIMQYALNAVNIAAAHRSQLLGLSVAADKNVWSLLISCLKLAQAGSSIHEADAVALAQRIHKIGLDITAAASQTYRDWGSKGFEFSFADPVADLQRQVAQLDWQRAQLDAACMLTGRSFYTICSILQHARDAGAARDQHQDKQLPWFDILRASVDAIMQSKAFRGHPAVRRVGERDASISQFKTIVLDLVCSTAAAGVIKQHSAGKGCQQSRYKIPQAELERAGSQGLVSFCDAAAAVCAEIPVPFCCNNPCCINVGCKSELQLVSGKGSICSGCHKARYCSRSCQKQHWKQHKPLCGAQK